jgi:hypothetical protein
MKKGGNAEHDDEEQDKKLISKMIKKEDAAEGRKAKKYQAGGGVSSDEEDTPAPQASSTTSAAPASSGFGWGDALKGATSLTKSLSAPSASKSDQAARAQSEQNRAADAAKQAAGTTQALASKPIQSGGFKPGEVPGATPQLKPLYKKGGAVKAGSHSGLGRLQKISAARKVPAKTEI